jgi:hypothetical protein
MSSGEEKHEETDATSFSFSVRLRRGAVRRFCHMCSPYGLLLRVNPFDSRGPKLMRVCPHDHAVE